MTRDASVSKDARDILQDVVDISFALRIAVAIVGPPRSAVCARVSRTAWVMTDKTQVEHQFTDLNLLSSDNN